MLGSATLTTRLSRTTMNRPTETMPRVHMRRRLAAGGAKPGLDPGGVRLGLADGGVMPVPADGGVMPVPADGGASPGLADGGVNPRPAAEARPSPAAAR